MYFLYGVMRACAFNLLLIANVPAVPVLPKQEGDLQEQSRLRLISAARTIMATARYCALITLDARGGPQARAMDPFSPTEDMEIWFGTNPASRKVREIRRNPNVSIFYIDPASQAYVTIRGIARIVDDPQEKARHWKDEWKDFYPDRDKSYLLIAVTPERLEVVSVKQGLTGDSKNWGPPTVTFNKRRLRLRKSREQ